MKSQFADTTSSPNFFDIVLFLLLSLVTGPSFMSISSLVLELWQFSLIRDWPEIRKSEIPISEFYPISEDWNELEIPNLAQMSLMKCYWLLQNSRVTTLSVSELLWESQQGVKLHPSHTQIRVKQNVTSTTFKLVHHKCPAYINEVFRPVENIRINTRNSYLKLNHPFRKTSTGKSGLSNTEPAVWNNIPEILKKNKNFNTFKHKMKTNIWMISLIKIHEMLADLIMIWLS